MLRMGPSRYQARVLRVLEAMSHPRLAHKRMKMDETN